MLFDVECEVAALEGDVQRCVSVLDLNMIYFALASSPCDIIYRPSVPA